MIVIVHCLAGPKDVKVTRAADLPTAHAWIETLPEDRSAYVADTESTNWVEVMFEAPTKRATFFVDLFNSMGNGENATVNKFADKETAYRRVGLRIIEQAQKSDPVAVPVASVEPPQPSKETKVSDTEQQTEGTKRGGGRRSSLNREATIVWHVNANPMKPGKKNYDRFAARMGSRTVGEALDKGATTGDLIYDHEHGYLQIAGQPGFASKKKEPKADAAAAA